MTPWLRHLSLASAALASGAALGGVSPISPQKVEQTRARIDALYHYRQAPPPAPDSRANPFRLGDPAADPDAAPGSAEAATSDTVRLQRLADGLRINGVVEIGGRIHVVLNETTYKEGDILSLRVQGSPVYLRIRRITSTQVTLALNEVETTIRIPYSTTSPLPARKAQ